MTNLNDRNITEAVIDHKIRWILALGSNYKLYIFFLKLILFLTLRTHYWQNKIKWNTNQFLKSKIHYIKNTQLAKLLYGQINP